MAIPVKLQTFEGPLDLLLHLIEKNKVSIYDIPIVEITDQYMEYISQISEETMDVMSEFLVMAATLLDIKSRMLLPARKSEEEEEEDPREELVERLLEYKMYKQMSYELRDRMEEAGEHFYKEATLPKEVEDSRQSVDLDDLLRDVTLQSLYGTFQTLMRRQEDRIDTEHQKFGTITREQVDMADTMRFVGDYIFQKRTCKFGEILSRKPGRQYKIVTFLTLLELMKEGKIQVRQPEAFADMDLTWVGGDSAEDLGELAALYE